MFDEPVCGMTWGWPGTSKDWSSDDAFVSMEKLEDLNVNWVTIAFEALQDHPQSTQIDFRDPSLVTDEQVRWAIRLAKKKGLKVCLKPVVNCRNGTWRGFISFFEVDVPAEPNWGEWFKSYEEYLRHFAKIAEEEQVELFCVGCEMVMADSRSEQWRNICSAVRLDYSGPITYNCDKYQEDRLTWWDAVDVISSSGYYPEHSWPEHLKRIQSVVAEHGKPFFFMEAGCPSRDASPARPNDWTLKGNIDLEAQARYYRELMDAFKQPWMLGFMLWDWPAVLYPESDADKNDDYCIYGKPAQQIVASAYVDAQIRRKLQ
jgi:hypothetical protein